jgi:aminopeptidase
VDGAEAGRLERLAALAVHGANVQPRQILMITAEIGNEETARAVAAAGYRRGAKFVEVDYFDPDVKRARIEHADPGTLDFVPPWYGERMLEHAAEQGARVTFATLTAPNLLDDLDKKLVGKDMLPRIKELTQIVGDRSTNWCIVPAPHPRWAVTVYPDLPEEEAYERLWSELEHVLRLDEPDPIAAWDERMSALNDAARRLTERAFDAFELRGPGTELSVGMLPTHRFWAADFTRADGLRHLPNLPTEEVFTTPDPQRTSGHVTSTKPLALRDGTIVRGLRVRFEDGVAVDVRDRAANGRRVQERGVVADETRLLERGRADRVVLDRRLERRAVAAVCDGQGFGHAFRSFSGCSAAFVLRLPLDVRSATHPRAARASAHPPR